MMTGGHVNRWGPHLNLGTTGRIVWQGVVLVGPGAGVGVPAVGVEEGRKETRGRCLSGLMRRPPPNCPSRQTTSKPSGNGCKPNGEEQSSSNNNNSKQQQRCKMRL